MNLVRLCIDLIFILSRDFPSKQALLYPHPSRCSIEFRKQLAPSDQVSTFFLNPFKKLHAGFGTIFTKHLMGDICINNRAHNSKTQRPPCLFHKETTVIIRCVQNVSQLIQSD